MFTIRGRWFGAASAALLVVAMASAGFSQPETQKLKAAPPPVASTGRIAGKVTEGGKTPIQFASVDIPELKRGVPSDENGKFVLTDVPAGTYTLRAKDVGHGTLTQQVTVKAGATVTVDFTFGEAKAVKTLEEIEVRAEKRIDVKSSQTTHTIDAAQLKALPVDNLREAVATKAGIVAQGGELHFRGGRGNEVKIQFDGVEATDPLFGRGANIANLAIAGTEIVTGGFDAEVGNALSGIISVSTKEGTERLAGDVRWDTDRYGDPTKTFDNLDRFSFGFGGPAPVKNLTYFATYEGTFSDTYLKSTLTKPRRTMFDFIKLGNRQFNQINTNFKLAYRPNARQKITFETINNRSINTPYNHMWSRQGYVKVTRDTIPPYTERFGGWSPTRVDSTYSPVNMPDHFPTLDDRYRQFTTVWTNQLSEKSVWTARLASLNFRTLYSVARKEPWEYWVQSPFYWSGNVQTGTENNPYYATHGDYPRYFDRNSSTWTLKTDFSTRHWKQHSFKSGLELKYNRVQNLSLTLPNVETNGLPGGSRSDFINFNPEGAYYMQDRWEFEGLVLNAGLRYDFFTPGDQVSDLDLRSGKRYKQQMSPRLGIAYPISDKDKLSFHYGWTYQTPEHRYIFENRGIGTSVGTRGNPDLEPETDIAYQAGMQHLFSRDVSGQFGVFFRDIYGLISIQQERDEFGNLVNVFVNKDYASSRGFEASLVKSFSHKFSAEINYTFSIATGVASDPNQALQFFNGGRLYLPISERPLDWDQRHTLSLSGNVQEPGKWGFRTLWTYGSGFPFSPEFRNNRREDPKLENSRRQPSKSNLAIDGDKFYKIWGQSVTLFFDARNVLDVPNISAISQDLFPNPYINAAGDDPYAIYYTETGRTGGAFLQDVNGDGVLDWVPVRDPRVFEEGRNVRMGLSVSF